MTFNLYIYFYNDATLIFSYTILALLYASSDLTYTIWLSRSFIYVFCFKISSLQLCICSSF